MNRLKLILSAIFGFIKPFAATALTKAGPVLAMAAKEAVAITAEGLLDGSGRGKRDHAYRLISKDLRRQGLSIGTDITTGMVNMAIEVAVANLKAK